MRFFFFILIQITAISVFAQELEVDVVNGSFVNNYELLNSSSNEIKSDKLLNQKIVDLVEPMLIDSTYKRKTERHRVVGGGLIRLLGFRWKTVKNTREKFVGVVSKQYLRGGFDDKFTEYDINYNLDPYLPKYVELAYQTYQAQLGMKNNKKKKETDQEPYIRPSAESNMTNYKLHCELTPPEAFRAQLNTQFYPVHSNNNSSVHPNFKDPNPVLGMYGPLILDCNHSCHPELHPYEWIWWLDNTETDVNTKTWWVGLMRDVSNRFKHWSDSPRTGSISIPFLFPKDATDWTIDIEHQMFNGFDEQAYLEYTKDKELLDFKELNREIVLNFEDGSSKSVAVNLSEIIPYNGIGYSIEHVQLDEELNMVAGELHLAMSARDIYTAKVSTKYNSAPGKDLEELLSQMSGSFSSGAQAASDTDFYDISLHMYPIWEDSAYNAHYIYVEQALGRMPEKPYRQRVYKVEQLNATTFSSSIYMLPDAQASVGQWKDVTFFNQWTPADIELKDGCAVILTKIGDGRFKGSTIEDHCPSKLYGSEYATSEVDIYMDKIISWDRGFDDKGDHIWGAEKGGYVFDKVEIKE